MIKSIKSKGSYLLFTATLLIFTGIILSALGRLNICSCNYILLWTSDVNSSDNSQHISDWYTFSHIIHGMLFYYLFSKIFPKSSLFLRFAMSMLLEAGWEILENSPMIINRYRSATIAFNYVGDTILNSLSDILAMALGFFIAHKYAIKYVLLSIILMEVVVGYLIRDNLTLNVLMLIFPLESIKAWQLGI